MITQTAGQTDIRAVNLAVVLGHLRREAPCSRAAIAAATGLNKATVTSIVGDLIDRSRTAAELVAALTGQG